MIKNKRGSITIISIYIINFILLLTILTRIILLESISYYQYQQKNYKLFQIESMFIKDIYHDYQNISFKTKEYSYNGYIIESIGANTKIIIKLFYLKEVREYEIEYDPLCQRIINMVEKEEIHTN